MKIKLTYKEYMDSILAQCDSGGYDPYGWIAGVHGDVAYLTTFGHCSCYGTWEALTGSCSYDHDDLQTFTPNWSGTYDELMVLAKEHLDPDMPDRKVNDSDYDSGYLKGVYDALLKRESALTEQM